MIEQKSSKPLSKKIHTKETKETLTKEIHPESLKLSNLLAILIKNNNPKNKYILDGNFEGSVKRWAEDINKINEIDKQTWKDIEDVINWCQNDSFWKANILSGLKLREKFTQLQTKMLADEDKEKPIGDFEIQEKWRPKKYDKQGNISG